MEFNLLKAFKFPSISSECHRIDMINSLVQETLCNHDSNKPLKQCLLNDSFTKDENPEVAMCALFFKASPQVSPILTKVETLMIDVQPSSHEQHAPKVELKPLPPSLRYKFYGLDSTYPVIVNVSLSASQVDSSLRIIRLHRQVIGYTLDDLKGIHPSMYLHRIFMEDDHKPSIEHQRILNSNIQEVVKKEILKLLKVNIINHICDS